MLPICTNISAHYALLHQHLVSASPQPLTVGIPGSWAVEEQVPTPEILAPNPVILTPCASRYKWAYVDDGK